MKITETDKGNIKIIMSKEHAKALYNLLDRLEFKECIKLTSEEEAFKLLDLWAKIEEKHLDHFSL